MICGGIIQKCGVRRHELTALIGKVNAMRIPIRDKADRNRGDNDKARHRRYHQPHGKEFPPAVLLHCIFTQFSPKAILEIRFDL